MLVLQNKGELDLNGIKLLGMSAKDTGNPIGHFGTGFKYAIATLLRNNIPITLYIGKNKYEFLTEKVTMRGKEFEECILSGPYDHYSLNFVTELGKNWDLWQALRELYSNCLDEGGSWYNELVALKDNTTTIVIDSDELPAVDSIFLTKDAPLVYRSDAMEIYDRPSKYVYYRGIRVSDMGYSDISESRLTYNILAECKLTEDRTLFYHHVDFVYRARNELVKLTNPDIIKDLACNKWAESYLQWLDELTNDHTTIISVLEDNRDNLTYYAEGKLRSLANTDYDERQYPSESCTVTSYAQLIDLLEDDYCFRYSSSHDEDSRTTKIVVELDWEDEDQLSDYESYD